MGGQWWAKAGSAQEKMLPDSKHESKESAQHLGCVNDRKGHIWENEGEGQRGQERAERYNEGAGEDLHPYQLFNASNHFSIQILNGITESLFHAAHKVDLCKLFETAVYSQLIPKARSCFFMVMITLQKKRNIKKYRELWPGNIWFFLIGITQPREWYKNSLL